MLINKNVQLKNVTKEEHLACDLYSRFLVGARFIGFDKDQINKLLYILDCLRYGNYIGVEDISLLNDFISDIDVIRETFFCNYDETIQKKMLGLINKINNEMKQNKED